MEPITALATTVVSLIGSYVAKGAQKFAEEAGPEAFKGVKRIWTTLLERWSGKQEGAAVLDQFERKPERYGPILKEVLAEELEANPDLVTELTGLVQQLGPVVEVVQRMDEARQVTGVEADELTEGRVHVQQEITRAEGVKGATFKRIGGR